MRTRQIAEANCRTQQLLDTISIRTSVVSPSVDTPAETNSSLVTPQTVSYPKWVDGPPPLDFLDRIG